MIQSSLKTMVLSIQVFKHYAGLILAKSKEMSREERRNDLIEIFENHIKAPCPDYEVLNLKQKEMYSFFVKEFSKISRTFADTIKKDHKLRSNFKFQNN